MPVSWWSRRMWGAHLVGAILLLAASGLGYWQMSVWHQARLAAQIDLTTEAPVPLASLFGSDDPFPGNAVGRPVTITGTWVGQGTVAVSGREHDGVEGYWIVTPVAVADPASTSDPAGEPAIPVVRGWLPDLTAIPDPPRGPVTLTGWLQPGEGSLVVDKDTSDDVVPQMRIADLIQHVDQDLYGGYAISQEKEPGLEQADLAQMPSTGAGEGLRNFLYALEWWCFGVFAIVLWWRYVQELRHPEPEPEPDPEPDPEPGAESDPGAGPGLNAGPGHGESSDRPVASGS